MLLCCVVLCCLSECTCVFIGTQTICLDLYIRVQKFVLVEWSFALNLIVVGSLKLHIHSVEKWYIGSQDGTDEKGGVTFTPSGGVSTGVN